VIHHVGYVVEDIPAAVEWAVSTLGAGPFFLIEHLGFDEVTYRGEPALYDHSSAFGQWGEIKLELTHVHAASAGLAETLIPRGVGHVAWLAGDLDAETARLTASGLELFHTGRAGPVRAHWFDARATLGHHVEVLQTSPELLGFYELMRRSARGLGRPRAAAAACAKGAGSRPELPGALPLNGRVGTGERPASRL
jgi:catechol 2,3-dioxygenase-like lactoylglutathione lyase family enzyme